ncbi:MAG: N-acetylneuraminate synthase [Parcubacteria group bacterium GW2011_GWB1_50_9]|uniref:N-acetylneuraminate synthase n=1 Tax=Candidatus Kaiserbacteria bacterium GW2011_GWC2_52_8b TaxID=1618676 RepID=A0A0G1ZTZ2_9BACT|nr:MAG: N-acetylneuraminate synthase [Parcubacteria group bacterium GW2011_GWB1_50_9]KKW24979.1 MAG: N-acetylneuraminate synthase [candidate division Kazan bacterium GW2011_GWC1_52_13]KKW31777.1 MAG: N-acetylneuraminate synthase [Candidatus Kaiserbacteria bacterium GW2011_GWC2_52_8b]
MNTPSPVVTIFNKKIGPGHPVFIVAEIGNNHNGNINLARRSIEAAAHAGADAVKFQKRTVRDVFARELLEKNQAHSRSFGKTYEEYRLTQELKDEEIAGLKEYAHSLGVAFFVTPFDLKSAEILASIGMDCWKIASFDLRTKPLLEFVARNPEPLFLSTGTATLDEIDDAVNTVLEHNRNLIIKQCVSIYPTPDENLNIGAIKTLKERYQPIPVGYSGHELGFIPTIAAVALGVVSVERHFTLDKTLPGPDHSTVSLDPFEFTMMCSQIRRIEKAVADTEVRCDEKEIGMLNKHGKSVVSRGAIRAGTVITADVLTIKSPGYGIKPAHMHTVIGKTAKVDIPEDTVIVENFIV